MPTWHDFDSFVPPGQRLCLDLDWCEKTPTRWGCRWKKSEGSERLEYASMVMTPMHHAPITFHFNTYRSVQDSETAPATLYVVNLLGKSWFSFSLEVLWFYLMLSWCWGCYYISYYVFDWIFFQLRWFGFSHVFVRISIVPLPSNGAWLRRVTGKMSVWAPFVMCSHAHVDHTGQSFYTQKRSDLRAWIIFSWSTPNISCCHQWCHLLGSSCRIQQTRERRGSQSCHSALPQVTRSPWSQETLAKQQWAPEHTRTESDFNNSFGSWRSSIMAVPFLKRNAAMCPVPGAPMSALSPAAMLEDAEVSHGQKL